MSRSEFIFTNEKPKANPMEYLPFAVFFVALLSVICLLLGLYRVFQTIAYGINIFLQGWTQFNRIEKED